MRLYIIYMYVYVCMHINVYTYLHTFMHIWVHMHKMESQAKEAFVNHDAT